MNGTDVEEAVFSPSTLNTPTFNSWCSAQGGSPSVATADDGKEQLEASVVAVAGVAAEGRPAAVELAWLLQLRTDLAAAESCCNCGLTVLASL